MALPPLPICHSSIELTSNKNIPGRSPEIGIFRLWENMVKPAAKNHLGSLKSQEGHHAKNGDMNHSRGTI